MRLALRLALDISSVSYDLAKIVGEAEKILKNEDRMAAVAGCSPSHFVVVALERQVGQKTSVGSPQHGIFVNTMLR